MNNRFIALEGADGCGKSTQVDRLADSLRQQGEQVITVREPGSTSLGERVRTILLDGEEPLCAEAEALLFLSSRAQLLDEVIEPALAAGQWVIADRFHISTVVYQGLAGELGEQRAAELCHVVIGERRPALNLIIEITAEEIEKRIARRSAGGSAGGDRFESRPGIYQRTATAFRQVQGIPGDRIVRIDGSGSEDEVATRIEQEVIVGLR